MLSNQTTPPQSSSFEVESSVNPTNPPTNSHSEITVKINPNTSLSDVIIDIEIYDSSDTKVFQYFYQNQNLTSGIISEYKANWAPIHPGNYRIKVGIFNNHWASLVHWFDDVGNITVIEGVSPTPTQSPAPTQSPSPTPTTQPPPEDPTPTPNPEPQDPGNETEIDIIWPEDNSSINGIQVFRALLATYEPPSYRLFWQVNGGQLNEMVDANIDGQPPHKEATVDVTHWYWQENGPYKITIVAKDSQDNTISEKQVNININR